MALAHAVERGQRGTTLTAHEGAAWSERAARRERGEVRRRAGDRHEGDALLAPSHGGLHEAFGVRVSGTREELGVCSTMRPAYITAAWSAISAATPRSWVTKTTARPRRRWRSRS